MPNYRAIEDGFLSNPSVFVKAGQVVSIPEGQAPVFKEGETAWLVPADRPYTPASVLPPVGAAPMSTEERPKAHTMEIDRPDYDAQMAVIQTAERVQDGEAPAEPIDLSGQYEAPADLQGVSFVDEGPVEPVIDAAFEETANQDEVAAIDGTGTQEVL